MSLAARMGIVPSAYWELSCQEFLALVVARQGQAEEKSSLHLEVMEMLRDLLTLTYNLNVEKRDRKKPNEMVLFTSDKLKDKPEREKKLITQKQLKKEAAERKNRGRKR